MLATKLSAEAHSVWRALSAERQSAAAVVWAKMRFSPAWPALVVANKQNHRSEVFFLGSHDQATVSDAHIFGWTEHYEQLHDKSRSARFSAALGEAEALLDLHRSQAKQQEQEEQPQERQERQEQQEEEGSGVDAAASATIEWHSSPSDHPWIGRRGVRVFDGVMVPAPRHDDDHDQNYSGLTEISYVLRYR
eukprot:COSAG01_NODE_1382_length_10521_cov_61.545001_8_plen_192_part_00